MFVRFVGEYYHKGRGCCFNCIMICMFLICLLTYQKAYSLLRDFGVRTEFAETKQFITIYII